MPGVAAGDDFRSDFAVRGAGPRQTGFIFDGIESGFLLHTVQQVNDAGSIAMVNGEILDSVTLRAGSYAEHYGDRMGAEVEFHVREGSRDRVRAHASVSMVDASAVAEGPLGSGKHGSWLVAARKSYLDLVIKRLYADQNLSFGFTDVQSKLAWHVSDSHQITLSMTGGRSKLDLVPNAVSNPNDLRDAVSTSGVAVLAWRYSPLRNYLNLREIIRNAAGETLDLKPYEADMRHLIDTYIEADPAKTISNFGEIGLLDLILKSGIADAILEGRANAVNDVVKAVAEGDDEFVEVAA